MALAQQALTQDVIPTVDTVVNVCHGVAGNHSIIGAMNRERVLDPSFLCTLTVGDCVRLGKALGELGGTASESAVVMVLRCVQALFKLCSPGGGPQPDPPPGAKNGLAVPQGPGWCHA